MLFRSGPIVEPLDNIAVHQACHADRFSPVSYTHLFCHILLRRLPGAAGRFIGPGNTVCVQDRSSLRPVSYTHLKAYGSTKSGIAPFYADKVSKIGIQVNELFDDDVLRERLEKVCQLKNALFVHLYHKDPLDPQALYDEMVQQRELIRPYVGDAARFVHTALREGKTVLLEGQLGTMKDPDFGIYPMTTSSNTLAGYGCIGDVYKRQLLYSLSRVVRPAELHSRSAEENCPTGNVASLRSVKVATPPLRRLCGYPLWTCRPQTVLTNRLPPASLKIRHKQILRMV